jgi:methionyl-tRNA formyltransferase
MQIDAGLDTGDMLQTAETDIGPAETAVELGARLALMGADLLARTLAGLESRSIAARKQDPALATYAPLLKKEDGRIDWSLPAEAIHNRVRGFQPWPGAYTAFRGGALRIWRSRPAAASCLAGLTAGRLASIGPLVVSCGSGALELIEVQLEGRRRMSAADFANGHRLSENDLLGEPRT